MKADFQSVEFSERAEVLLLAGENVAQKDRKVLWRSGVILCHGSQNNQAEWVRDAVGPHHLSVMTRGRRRD